MNNPKRYTITAALPYANGPLHIGHMAGVYIPADIYVKYLRLRKRDVLFVCGTDEHGAAITLKAKKDGVSPQKIVDEYFGVIDSAFKEFGIDFDIFHRTSAPVHHETAQAFFLKLIENDTFEVRESEQYFDEEAGQFLADRYISGTCPKCGHDGAYGDQCENCGSTLSPTELIEPKSTLSGTKPVLRKTSHWFLPLNKHEDWLRDWLENGKLNGVQQHDPATWKRQVIGQCKSWIDGGLQPRAMTRDLDWGVKVPLDNADGKVLYVWLDA
ncbi:MAG TPA: class I tRNA ligase family protein, partial [Cryomorphaceae bacterium]|nr:class I tRNA ligase family protein [Cryomorphaceae bacterium]